MAAELAVVVLALLGLVAVVLLLLLLLLLLLALLAVLVLVPSVLLPPGPLPLVQTAAAVTATVVVVCFFWVSQPKGREGRGAVQKQHAMTVF